MCVLRPLVLVFEAERRICGGSVRNTNLSIVSFVNSPSYYKWTSFFNGSVDSNRKPPLFPHLLPIRLAKRNHWKSFRLCKSEGEVWGGWMLFKCHLTFSPHESSPCGWRQSRDWYGIKGRLLKLSFNNYPDFSSHTTCRLMVILHSSMHSTGHTLRV